MRSEYEDEIYRFFTQSENFDMMVKVAGHLPEVKAQVINNFWNDLKAELEKTVKELRGNWIVGFSNKPDFKYNKLWIYKKEWLKEGNSPILAIAIEDLFSGMHPYMGVWLDASDTKHDIKEINTTIAGLPELNGFQTETSNLHWPRWKYLEYNLYEVEHLKRLLPEFKGANLAYTNDEFINIAKELQDKGDEIIRNNMIA